MLKIINEKDSAHSKLIRMDDLKPLEVAIIKDDNYPEYAGKIVMRTASLLHFEVINLTNPRIDGCWSKPATLLVEKLTEPIIIKLWNE